MKRIILLAALCACSTAMSAQRKVQIGSTEILLQSPLKVTTIEARQEGLHTSHSSDMFIGFGLAVNDKNEEYMPISYGNSYDLQIGCRDVYRRGKSPIAAGSFVSLSFYSYKLDKAYLNNPLVIKDLGTIRKEYYRTSNITAGIFARLYLSSDIFIDFGPYGEYAYNRKYKVFTTLLGDKEESKIKYRDGSRFNPFNAGIQCSVGLYDFSVYAKYRLTNGFNHDKINLEIPRLNIGVQFSL